VAGKLLFQCLKLRLGPHLLQHLQRRALPLPQPRIATRALAKQFDERRRGNLGRFFQQHPAQRGRIREGRPPVRPLWQS
jgi:hypothetical protein